MNLGVVIPCYRQERFLPRTLAALEHALKDRSWSGALVLADRAARAPCPSFPRTGRWCARARTGR